MPFFFNNLSYDEDCRGPVIYPFGLLIPSSEGWVDDGFIYSNADRVSHNGERIDWYGFPVCRLVDGNTLVRVSLNPFRNRIVPLENERISSILETLPNLIFDSSQDSLILRNSGGTLRNVLGRHNYPIYRRADSQTAFDRALDALNANPPPDSPPTPLSSVAEWPVTSEGNPEIASTSESVPSEPLNVSWELSSPHP